MLPINVRPHANSNRATINNIPFEKTSQGALPKYKARIRHKSESSTDSERGERMTRYDSELGFENKFNTTNSKVNNTLNTSRINDCVPDYKSEKVTSPQQSNNRRRRAACYDRYQDTSIDRDLHRPTYAPNVHNNRDLGKILLNWKLTFDGSNNLSADSFLTKIEDRRIRLTQVTDDEMLLSLAALLDGLALKWFKINEKNFYSWQNF